MNLNFDTPVIIMEEDYELLKPFLNKTLVPAEEMSLSGELNRAVIVKKEAFPAHAIRINSNVQIIDEETGAQRELILVMPHQANIKEQKVSILSPIGAALIGFKQGDSVQWNVPAGIRRFKINQVRNELKVHSPLLEPQ